RPADTIIIGNPQIADASVQDPSTIVLTGKGFGVTNLVVMDDSGNVAVDAQVVASRSFANSVRIYRRSQVQTRSCSPFCESAFKNDEEQRAEAAMSAGFSAHHNLPQASLYTRISIKSTGVAFTAPRPRPLTKYYRGRHNANCGQNVT